MHLLATPRWILLAAAALPTTATSGQTVDVQRLSARILTANLPMLGQRQVVAVSAKRGLALIDTGASPLAMTKLEEEIERQFGRRDWAYVINTHGHIDGHVNGNAVFERIPIIGHENLAAEVRARLDAVASQRVLFLHDRVLQLQRRVDAGAEDASTLQAQIAVWRSLEEQMARREIALPNLTFSDELTIEMGDLTLHLLYFGRGHSASDVIVHIPEEKVLVSGGVCSPFFPTVSPSVRLADLRRSVSVLDRVLAGGVERVIPSHLGLLGRQDAERLRDYYRDLLAEISAARGRGASLEKAQTELLIDRRFPYMRDVQVAEGRREELHAANVAVVWRLLTEQ